MRVVIRKNTLQFLELFSSTSITARSISIDGGNSTAVIFGGLSINERQIMKHGELYTKHYFEVMPVASSLTELVKPEVIESRAQKFASDIQSLGKPVAMHAISAGFFTMIRTLKAMDNDWREKNVKSIVFDSCPLATDADGFGGAVAFLLKRHYLKPYLARLVSPYLYLCGITEERRKEFQLDIFGATSVIPRNSSILFIHDKNDPALNYSYLDSVIADIRRNKSENGSFHELILEKSRHALHLIDNEEEYTNNINDLLEKVKEWK